MKYRRVQPPVEAIRAGDAIDMLSNGPVSAAPPWLDAALADDAVKVYNVLLSVKTTRGWVNAGEHDWVVKMVSGDLEVVPRTEFEQCYEKVAG